MASPKPLPNAAFLVLALLAEGPAHGYQLERMVWNRGFRYWASAKRSAIYLALKRLEEQCLVASVLEQGSAAPRKVYTITAAGRDRLTRDAIEHLEHSDHPHTEMDLGVYALPFLDREQALAALEGCLATLRGRLGFLEERLGWCRDQGLPLVALNFERPALALRAELTWLEGVIRAIREGEVDHTALEWQRYEYRQPPEPRVKKDPEPRGGR
jgi:DNA-binding PadR family transcriptional regulator